MGNILSLAYVYYILSLAYVYYIIITRLCLLYLATQASIAWRIYGVMASRGRDLSGFVRWMPLCLRESLGVSCNGFG